MNKRNEDWILSLFACDSVKKFQNQNTLKWSMYIHLNFHLFLSILFLSLPIIWFLSSNLTWKIFWNHCIEALFLFNRYESHCVVHGTWSFTSSFSNQLGGITVSLLPAFYGPMGDSFLGACRASAVQEKNFYHCVTKC